MSPESWKKTGIQAIKWVLGGLVLFMVGRHVVATWTEFRGRGGTLHLDISWVGLAILLYLGGLCGFGLYFCRVLNEGATPVGPFAAVRAYLISHLGKYVPGKAMVVVMRVGMLTPQGARPATTAFASLYETLLMMGVGGLIAAAGFVLPPTQVIPMGIGLVLALAFLVVVVPRVFQKLSAVMSLPFRGVGPDAVPRLTPRLLGEGLLWSLGGWILLGLSQVSVIRAVVVEGVSPGWWPVVTASVALGLVAGFVIPLLPGGLGLREGVLMWTLVPAVGAEVAAISAVALRLTWVLAEVLAAAVLMVIRPAVPSLAAVEP